MNEGLIPNRYAKALYKFACEKGADQGLYRLTGNLVKSFADNSALKDAVTNPFVADDKKIQLLMTAAAGAPAGSASPKGTADDASVREVYADLLKLLKQNKRLAMAREIALAYREIYRRQNRIYRVTVVSAQPLDPSEEGRLKNLVASHLDGGKMEYTFRVDPDLIGGFTVDIDNERLDASVKNELKQLRLRLLGQA